MRGEDAIEMRESLTGVLERGEERRGGGEERGRRGNIFCGH